MLHGMQYACFPYMNLGKRQLLLLIFMIHCGDTTRLDHASDLQQKPLAKLLAELPEQAEKTAKEKYEDTHDENFTPLKDSTANFITPNKGDIWYVGSRAKIEIQMDGIEKTLPQSLTLTALDTTPHGSYALDDLPKINADSKLIFAFEIDENQPPGTYLLSFCHEQEQGPEMCFESNEFMIAEKNTVPELRVLSPRPGQLLTANKTYEITFTANEPLQDAKRYLAVVNEQSADETPLAIFDKTLNGDGLQFSWAIKPETFIAGPYHLKLCAQKDELFHCVAAKAFYIDPCEHIWHHTGGETRQHNGDMELKAKPGQLTGMRQENIQGDFYAELDLFISDREAGKMIEFRYQGDANHETGAIQWRPSQQTSGSLFLLQQSPKTSPQSSAVTYLTDNTVTFWIERKNNLLVMGIKPKSLQRNPIVSESTIESQSFQLGVYLNNFNPFKTASLFLTDFRVRQGSRSDLQADPFTCQSVIY